jgi:anti-sigma factor RsiW
MSEAPVTESELQAYADGRLDAKRRMAVEAWLATRPEEDERIADYRKLAKELRGIYDPVMSETLPPRFVRKRVQWRRFAFAVGWMLIGLLIASHLKAGERVEGAELSNSEPTLAVRVK